MIHILTPRSIPQLALFTGLVAVATMAFSIYVPATKGYFNVGESAVYAVALLAGAKPGAFAGGIGSMIADLALGFPLFAPATLVIKGAEGGILGLLASRQPRLSVRSWRVVSLALGAAIFLLVFEVGSLYYTGRSEISLGLPWIGSGTFSIDIPAAFWAALGLLAGGMIVATSFLTQPESGYLALCIVASGLIMVAGYFIYEQLVLGQAAVAEIPINVGQVLAGLIIALPVYGSLKALKRKMP